MEIELIRGKKAIIDDADWPLVSRYNWWATYEDGYWYATGKFKGGGWGRTKAVRMHRLIYAAKPRKMVDHINHDGLDNRRENLRQATNGQNQANRVSKCGTSRFKGVSWNREKGCWLRVDLPRRQVPLPRLLRVGEGSSQGLQRRGEENRRRVRPAERGMNAAEPTPNKPDRLFPYHQERSVPYNDSALHHASSAARMFCGRTWCREGAKGCSDLKVAEQ